jgi:SAM-dependent methyltransferase
MIFKVKRIFRNVYHYIFKIKVYKSLVGTSNESNRIEWLKKKLDELPEGFRILDAGAGEMPFKKYCNHLRYVSQDFGKYDPTEIESGLQVDHWEYGNIDIISDIAEIPEMDNSFDAIMCTEVLEHIINPREAIVEFSRLLKSDGFLILTAPFCSLTHFAPFHYYSGFNRYFYEKELKRNNFEIIEIISNGNFYEYLAQELNRLESVAKKYSNISLDENDKEHLSAIKITLQNLSIKDTFSNELLSHGFHVLAKKL